MNYKATAGCGVGGSVGVSMRKCTAPVARPLSSRVVQRCCRPRLRPSPALLRHPCCTLTGPIRMPCSVVSHPPARPLPRVSYLHSFWMPCTALFFWASRVVSLPPSLPHVSLFLHTRP